MRTWTNEWYVDGPFGRVGWGTSHGSTEVVLRLLATNGVVRDQTVLAGDRLRDVADDLDPLGLSSSWISWAGPMVVADMINRRGP